MNAIPFHPVVTLHRSNIHIPLIKWLQISIKVPSQIDIFHQLNLKEGKVSVSPDGVLADEAGHGGVLGALLVEKTIGVNTQPLFYEEDRPILDIHLFLLMFTS